MIRKHKGEIVPWTTKWTGELPAHEETVIEAWWNEPDWAIEARWALAPDVEIRQSINGILWMREGVNQGGGEPLPEVVHSARQRKAMLRGVCRICGERAWSEEGTVIFVVSPREILWTGDAHITYAPPVCLSCVDLVLDAHPYLREQGHEMYKVLEYTPWGVLGQIMTSSDATRSTTQKLPNFEISDLEVIETETRDARYKQFSHVIARQQIVELVKYAPYTHKEKS